MRSCYVNEVEKKISFPFCTPKEENEVEENDGKFFMVFEGKDEKPFYRRLNEVENEKL